MEMDPQTLLYGTASTIVLGGIVALGRLAKKWMDLNVESLENSIDRNRRDDIRTVLTIEANAASAIVERTYVKGLKASGQWDGNTEAHAEARRRAVQIAFSMLTEKDVELAKKEFGNVEDFLGLLVESRG